MRSILTVTKVVKMNNKIHVKIMVNITILSSCKKKTYNFVVNEVIKLVNGTTQILYLKNHRLY